MRKAGLLIVFVYLMMGAGAQSSSLIEHGIWQGVLHRPDENNIIFNFDAEVLNGKQILHVINADERLLVDDIITRGDSIIITMPYFDAYFSVAKTAEGNLSGMYYKDYGNRILAIPFTATHGVNERYPIGKPKHNISGRWEVAFVDGDKSTPAIGEFVQEQNGRVTGTFLTATGDYRYLEGGVKGGVLNLSGFNGGHTILFKATIKNKNTLQDGSIYSGLNTPSKWIAKRNETVELPDGYNMTKMREGETKLNFRFKSTTGDTISINDPRFANKVVVVQILGSWCPNCLDESKYLSEFYNANKDRGFEVVGIAYERTTNFETSVKSLTPFQKRLQIQYPILVANAAVSDPERAEKTLPQLTKIEAFPTSIFIDKKGNVRKIHTGYDGPATGKHYVAYIKQFEDLVNSLLSE